MALSHKQSNLLVGQRLFVVAGVLPAHCGVSHPSNESYDAHCAKNRSFFILTSPGSAICNFKVET